MKKINFFLLVFLFVMNAKAQDKIYNLIVGNLHEFL
jgi:6-phosphogluconolactonase